MSLRALQRRSTPVRRSPPDSADALAEAAGLAAAAFRRDGKLLYVSTRASELLGANARASNIPAVCRLPKRVLSDLQRCIRNRGGKPQGETLRIAIEDERLCSCSLRPLPGSDVILAVFSDDGLSTDWRVEMRHHLRNALHVMAAVMHLSECDDHLKGRIDEMTGRIMAMARAHDAVTMMNGRPMADPVACISALHGLVMRARNLDDAAFSLVAFAASGEVLWDLEQTAPMALIIHELFTQTAQCAAEESPKAVRVEVGQGMNGEIALSMDGLCLGVDCLNTRMFAALIRQLRARMEPSDDGALRLLIPPPALPIRVDACIP